MRRQPDTLADRELPHRQEVLLMRQHAHFCYLDEHIKDLDREITDQLAEDDPGSRLLTIPCVGL